MCDQIYQIETGTCETNFNGPSSGYFYRHDFYSNIQGHWQVRWNGKRYYVDRKNCPPCTQDFFNSKSEYTFSTSSSHCPHHSGGELQKPRIVSFSMIVMIIYRIFQGCERVLVPSQRFQM